MKIRMIGLVLVISGMLAALTACGSSSGTEASAFQPAAESPASTAAAQETTAAETTQPSEAVNPTDTLVVYFSGTGTTRGVAQRIASVTGADLYEIQAAQPYTEADLNYNDSSSRATMEQNDKSVRPEIGSEPVPFEGYKTIFLGFPIWWGQEPRIMDTFVESYSFDGLTIIPFCTSGSSSIGSSGSNMEALAGS